MRHLTTSMMIVASLVLTVLLALAGCGEDHGHRYREDRTVIYERHDNDRHEERHDSDRHEDHGGDSGHEHGDR